MNAASRRPSREEGSALLLALLILAALAILATTAVVSSMGDRNLSRYERNSVQALALAETGVAFAKRAIVEQTATMQDYDSDGRPDFVMTDSLNWGGTYSVIAEASDILAPGVAAYRSNGFSILSEGRFHGAIRRVKAEIVHDTFLKFGRYVSQQGLQFECGDVMAGEVYSGNSITLTCGCAPGREPHFLEKASTSGKIPQAGCGNFERGYEEDAGQIDLTNSIDWTVVRDQARGIATNNACEGRGSIGIYINLPVLDPLHLATQAGADANTLVLNRFDFHNTSLSPPDTVVTYGGGPVVNTVTGQTMRNRDFNGIVLFEGDARVRGSLDGVSASYLSVFGTDHVLVEGDVINGRTGFDPVTRLPNHLGSPVTSALIAENYVAFDATTPRILRIDAAIFSRTSRWQGLGGMGGHPPAAPGSYDLDLDGVYGETPVNNDPLPGIGWNELNPDAQTWVLNLTGPIITYQQGDPSPWQADPGGTGAPGYRLNYDISYVQFPPPCFPVPINVWVDVSWTEIFDSNSPLASHLPN